MKNIKYKKISFIFCILFFALLLIVGKSLLLNKPQIVIGQTASGSGTNDMLAAADVKVGLEISKTCNACHTFNKGEADKTGPNLFGIYGAKHAHKKDFVFSDALLKMKDKTWTVDELYLWLRDPAAYAPGTKMSFSGLLDPQDRLDLIAYLMTLK